MLAKFLRKDRFAAFFRPVFLLLVAFLAMPFNLKADTQVTMSVTGSIPRDLSSQTFYVTIVLKGVVKAVSGNNDYYAHRLQIYLLEHNENTYLPFSDIGPEENRSKVSFTISFPQAEKVEIDSTGQMTVTTYLAIKGRGTSLETLMEGKSYLTLRVKYTAQDGELGADQSGYKIEREVGLAAAAPGNISALGKHLGIVASYDVDSKIAYTKGSDRAPTGVQLFAVAVGGGDIEVPALVHEPDEESDSEEATCTIDSNADNDSACVSCDEVDSNSTYINTSKNLGDLLYGTNSLVSGKISMSDLEENTEYLLFLAYQPSGVVYSNCYRVTATKNITWSEGLDSNIKAEKKDPRCFIATAAYGDIGKERVDEFRWFRDEYLKGNPLGESFVDFYYTYSPQWADFLDEHPDLKPLVRGVLDPVADMIHTLH